MLIPAQEELPVIVIGGTWEIEIQLFENEAETIPFNLTGWTTLLDIKEVTDLTSGSGLVITPSEGLIIPSLTVAETTLVQGKEVRYFLRIEKAGKTFFPIRGGIPLLEP